LHPLGRVAVPGDPSSATFFAVAASIVPGARVAIDQVGLNPTRTHVFEVLRRMGGAVRMEGEPGWEPMGRLTVESSRLRAVSVAAAEVPLMIDELPALMVAAAAAEGVSTFDGLAELRVKETDRLQAMVTGLSRMGARIEATGPDGLRITGGRLRGAEVDSFGDHRTAMSLAVAGLVAEGQTLIRGAECVGKSFGEFFQALAAVAGSAAVRPA
jgi:3-phosphoshikimate 1-carboxyvinyltransferase